MDNACVLSLSNYLYVTLPEGKVEIIAVGRATEGWRKWKLKMLGDPPPSREADVRLLGLDGGEG